MNFIWAYLIWLHVVEIDSRLSKILSPKSIEEPNTEASAVEALAYVESQFSISHLPPLNGVISTIFNILEHMAVLGGFYISKFIGSNIASTGLVTNLIVAAMILQHKPSQYS